MIVKSFDVLSERSARGDITLSFSLSRAVQLIDGTMIRCDGVSPLPVCEGKSALSTGQAT